MYRQGKRVKDPCQKQTPQVLQKIVKNVKEFEISEKILFSMMMDIVDPEIQMWKGKQGKKFKSETDSI
jgi:hypothetical protein